MTLKEMEKSKYPIEITTGITHNTEIIEEELDFKALQRLVDGYVEIVDLGGDHALVIDEDGRAKGRSVNYTASAMAKHVAPHGIRGSAVYIRKDVLREIL